MLDWMERWTSQQKYCYWSETSQTILYIHFEWIILSNAKYSRIDEPNKSVTLRTYVPPPPNPIESQKPNNNVSRQTLRKNEGKISAKHSRMYLNLIRTCCITFRLIFWIILDALLISPAQSVGVSSNFYLKPWNWGLFVIIKTCQKGSISIS